MSTQTVMGRDGRGGMIEVQVVPKLLDNEPPATPKPKRVNKKTRALLDAEYKRGFAEAMDRDRGMEMLGSVGLGIATMLMGFGFGAWLF
jgi:hypothetical protein